MTTIYALLDPDSLAVRYIGKTRNKLHRRLSGHMRDRTPCHRTNWLKSLGRKPLIQAIETCDDGGWVERERFWIAEHRRLGSPLTNETSGGDGPAQYDEHIRRKISAALKGRKNPCTAHRAAAISAAKKGKSNGRLGYKMTDETKAKLSAAHKGRTSPNKGIPQSPEMIRKRVASRIANRLKQIESTVTL